MVKDLTPTESYAEFKIMKRELSVMLIAQQR